MKLDRIACAIALAAGLGLAARAEVDTAPVRELLAIPSVSKDVAANDRAIEWMKARLERHGVWCVVETLPKDGRKILYAATKPGLEKPDYVLVTHLDVVAPASPKQFEPVERDGRLYARGACDTKVNAYCGAEALIRLNGRGSVGCVFASDEEIGGNTTKHAVACGHAQPQKAVIVLDAGGMNPHVRTACKGNAYYLVTATGRSGHSSRPDKCDNPIYRLAEAALRVRDAYPHQKPGEYGNTASVTIIGAGDSQNRIPETASMTVNVRFVNSDLEGHRRLIEKITGLKTELLRGTPAAVSRDDDPEILRMQKLMQKVYPERKVGLSRSDGANDSRYFPQFGRPMMSVSMDHAGGHTDDEWVRVADIPRFTGLLVEFLSPAGGAAAEASAIVPVRNAAFGEMENGKVAGWDLPKAFRVDRGAGLNGSPCLVRQTDVPAKGNATQKLPQLAVGKRYRFGAKIKTGSDFAGAKRAKDGAKMCLAWYDANGKWIHESHTGAVSEPGTDWTDVVGTTVPMPSNAVSFRVSLFAGANCVGTCWYDDVFVMRADPPVVSLVRSSAYRDLAAGGRLAALANVHLPDGVSAAEAEILFTLAGADGAARTFRGAFADATCAQGEFDAEDLPAGAYALACEVSAGGKALGRAQCRFTRVKELPARKVFVDAKNRLVVDGKPFFPLGMYTGSMEDPKYPGLMETYAKSPFNCACSYYRLNAARLDAYRAHGIRVLEADLRREKTVERVCAKIDEFKDHPALLGWYVFDEPPLAMIPWLETVQRLVRERDPNHPTWGVMDVPDNLREYAGCCDVLGVDPYPIATKGPIGRVLRDARLARDANLGTRPTWNVPQTFSWNWIRPHLYPNDRIPTREEFRNMFWQHVAGGANGLVCYIYNDFWKYPPECLPNYRGHWEGVCAAAQEVKDFIPVLLTDEEAPALSGETAGLGVRAWRKEGAVYVLAVNATREPLAGALAVAEGPWTRCAPVNGAGVTLAADGSLAVSLPPLGVAIVRIER